MPPYKKTHGSRLRRLPCVFLRASQEGLEPPTTRLEGECSIQLSYWDKSIRYCKWTAIERERGFLRTGPLPMIIAKAAIKRVKGIEPSPQAWEAGVLPLNYTRVLRLPHRLGASICYDSTAFTQNQYGKAWILSVEVVTRKKRVTGPEAARSGRSNPQKSGFFAFSPENGYHTLQEHRFHPEGG